MTGNGPFTCQELSSAFRGVRLDCNSPPAGEAEMDKATVF
jgi:hypothetical protein